MMVSIRLKQIIDGMYVRVLDCNGIDWLLLECSRFIWSDGVFTKRVVNTTNGKYPHFIQSYGGNSIEINTVSLSSTCEYLYIVTLALCTGDGRQYLLSLAILFWTRAKFVLARDTHSIGIHYRRIILDRRRVS